MEQDCENQAKDEIHQLYVDSLSTFLTKEEHNKYFLERGEIPTKETKDFKKIYQLVVLDLQRQIGLRRRYVPIMRNKDARNKASTSKPKNDTSPKDGSKNVTYPKGKERKEDNTRSSKQGQTSFILEAKIAKIKISIPLTELLKNYEYHSKIATVLMPPEEIYEI